MCLITLDKSPLCLCRSIVFDCVLVSRSSKHSGCFPVYAKCIVFEYRILSWRQLPCQLFDQGFQSNKFNKNWFHSITYANSSSACYICWTEPSIFSSIRTHFHYSFDLAKCISTLTRSRAKKNLLYLMMFAWAMCLCTYELHGLPIYSAPQRAEIPDSMNLNRLAKRSIQTADVIHLFMRDDALLCGWPKNWQWTNFGMHQFVAKQSLSAFRSFTSTGKTTIWRRSHCWCAHNKSYQSGTNIMLYKHTKHTIGTLLIYRMYSKFSC